MTGPRNLITDVPGVLVGNAHDEKLASGVTVALFERAAAASCVFPGGAPGSRDTACLEPEMTVEEIDAVVLSGGSGFGLDAATGAQAWLRERGRGYLARSVRIPIVPQAICFDLLNGGDKAWGRFPPYRELAYAACNAAAGTFRLGTAGGGYGAGTVNLKGGLGSASALTGSGFAVGALAVVNALGSAVVGDGPHFWAAPYEREGEFGGLGGKPRLDPDDLALRWKGGPATGTTLAVVATDAVLTPAELKRIAVMANAGLARALRLVHAPRDGDTVFAVATARAPLAERSHDLTEIGAVAADCLARAVARGVYEAASLPFAGALPAWKDRFRS
jgi:L-aminopeptidase/D-esterase-like protein